MKVSRIFLRHCYVSDSEWVVLSEVLILVQRISTFFKADQSDALSSKFVFYTSN